MCFHFHFLLFYHIFLLVTTLSGNYQQRDPFDALTKNSALLYTSVEAYRSASYEVTRTEKFVWLDAESFS